MKNKVMMNIEIEESLKNLFKEACYLKGLKMNYVMEKLMRNWIKKTNEKIANTVKFSANE